MVKSMKNGSFYFYSKCTKVCVHMLEQTQGHTHTDTHTFKHYSIVIKFHNKEFIAKGAHFGHQRCSDRQKGQG